jgi:methylenetetrahydrofolate reductase (NADPH)
MSPASPDTGRRAERRLRLSFEFFPPKSEAHDPAFGAVVKRLASFAPDFVSVTYGAAGSSQARSVNVVRQVAGEGLPTAAHLTCVGASRTSLEQTIDSFRALGIERFVALRGDPPGGVGTPYRPHPEGFQDTADLVRCLRGKGATDVSVSAYPERHPQSPDWETELAVLRRKTEAGAARAITQFFFDNDLFDRYRDRVRRAGIDLPVVPGILPIHRFASVETFAARCGASVPTDIRDRFADIGDDPEAHRSAAAEIAAEQIVDLRKRGVDAFHIYTINGSALTEAVLDLCGVEAGRARRAA